MREAIVDLAAIRDNVAAVAAVAAPAAVMVVVKADGYGHGAVPVARAAVDAGAGWLGVVDLAEAHELRQADVALPILAWLHRDGADFASAIGAGIDLGVGSVDQLDQIARAGRADVHLKADTGLSRGGAVGEEWLRLVERAGELERTGAVRVVGLWSHLANAGFKADAAQLAAFEDAVAAARSAGLDPRVEHVAASAALFRHPGAHRSLVRVGLAAYGLSPIDDRLPADLGLRPAMELAGEVVLVKRVPAGSGVSYGHTYTTDRDTTLALVPVGYADGLPRSGSGRGPVWLRGERFAVAGRIAMDQVVIDVGDAPVAVGDRAVFFGDAIHGYPTAQDWADATDTIAYEIVSRLGPRVERRYLG